MQVLAVQPLKEKAPISLLQESETIPLSTYPEAQLTSHSFVVKPP